MLKNQTILLQKQDEVLHQQAEGLIKVNRNMGTLESSVNKNFKDVTQIVTTVKVVLTAGECLVFCTSKDIQAKV